MSLRRYFQRKRWDAERQAELASYVESATAENVARGMNPAEARAAAQRKLGNPTAIREEIYRMNTLTMFDSFGRLLRQTLRGMRRSPMFTAAAVLTLAIGIGANTAVFSVVNSVLLNPLSYPHSEQLVGVWHKAPGAPGLSSVAADLPLSPSMFFTYSEQNQVFQSIGVWTTSMASVTGLAEPEQVRAVTVSEGALETLGVRPVLGRWLAREDQTPNGPRRGMLGYGYWQRRFGGDPGVLGKQIRVESQPVEIVGVMPQGFRFVTVDMDLIVPYRFDRSGAILAGFGHQGIARLKPGVTVAQANAEVGRLIPIWQDSWSNPGGGKTNYYTDVWKVSPAVRAMKQDVVGNVGSVLWVVMGTIGLVMLIACANVANLLLARGEARHQELAVRAALGAGWGRIVREMLFESTVLGMIGGAGGVAIAYWGLQVLVMLGPSNLPRLNEIALDGRALEFTFGLSVLSGVLFGLIPALKYAGPRISLGLRVGGRAASASRERHRSRNVLVVSQVALALVLLVSAGLMIRTFQALRTVDPGFTDARHLQTLRIAIPQTLVPEPEKAMRVEQQILDNIVAIPGVTSAGLTTSMPMEGIDPNWDEIYATDKTVEPGKNALRMFKFVSPGFFKTTGTRIIAGRDYTWSDLYERHAVTIVSENFAKEFWGSAGAAIGKRIGTRPDLGLHEIIGVVQDVRNNGVQEAAPSIIYWAGLMDDLYPTVKNYVSRYVTVVIRTDRAGMESFLSQARSAVWSVNGSVAVASTRTMQEMYDESMARTSFTLVMLAIAGGMALLLGVIGIYGVIAYTVSQRTREVGIRMALGARPGAVQAMFVTSGAKLAGVGIGIGLVAAAGLTRVMSSLLYGVGTFDVVTYGITAVVLLGVAVGASYFPARRVAAVDPIEALRAE